MKNNQAVQNKLTLRLDIMLYKLFTTMVLFKYWLLFDLVKKIDKYLISIFGKKIKKTKDEEKTKIKKDDKLFSDSLLISMVYDKLNTNPNNIGKPNKITYYEQDGMIMEETIWDSGADEIKLVGGYIINFNNQKPKINNNKSKLKINLNDQLEIAIKNEDYKEAARLRDLIDKQKNESKK